jgi:hypothetical protein
MTTYMASGKNEADDAQDTITGVVEKVIIQPKLTFASYSR